MFDQLGELAHQLANHAGAQAGKRCSCPRDPGQLPDDPRDVETNASIACHRHEVQEDAANAEASKSKHELIVPPLDAATVANQRATVTPVIDFATGDYGATVEAVARVARLSPHAVALGPGGSRRRAPCNPCSLLGVAKSQASAFYRAIPDCGFGTDTAQKNARET